jgi:hypothetical protein
MAMRPGRIGKILAADLLKCCFRGRKLELEKFLSEHDVDICLLNETHF